MIVVSDSSPLIALARAKCFHLLPGLFPTIHIPAEAYDEIVFAGSGRPGAQEVAQAEWIHVSPVREAEEVLAAMDSQGLGAGEVAAVQLARELNADVILIDEAKARRYASESGDFILFGCVGILEMLCKKRLIADLRETYRLLIAQDFRIDPKIIENSLRKFGLKPI